MNSAQFRGGPIGVGPFGGLTRLPTFVRVVQNRTTRAYDVLNDVDDEPTDDEEIVAVYMLDPTSRVHVRADRKSGGCGWWVTYVYMPLQGVAELRGEREWCARLAAIVGVPVEVALEQRAAEREATKADG